MKKVYKTYMYMGPGGAKGGTRSFPVSRADERGWGVGPPPPVFHAKWLAVQKEGPDHPLCQEWMRGDGEWGCHHRLYSMQN